MRSPRHPWRRPTLERLENRLAPAAHDTLATALPLAFGGSPQVAVSGTLAAVNQVDLYAVSLAAGDELAAAVSAASPGSLAGSLRIFNGSGRQLAFAENMTAGAATDLTFDAPLAGAFYVGVASNGNYAYDSTAADSGHGGLTAGAYTLTLTTHSVLLSESPSNFTLATAQALTGNTLLGGTVASGATEFYQLTATAADDLRALVTPADATALLPRLALYGAAGQLLIQSDGASPAAPAASLSQHLQPGTYYLGVSAAVSSPSGNGAYVLDATLGPASSPFQAVPVGNFPSAVAEGDFAHNGMRDLVVVNSQDNTVRVMLGNGDGTFQPAVTYAVQDANGNGLDPVAVAVRDFNGDGNLDIVTANFQDSTVSVLLGNGDGTFRPAVTYSVADANGSGTNPSALAVGDFTGSGTLDLAVVTTGSDLTNFLFGFSTVSILLGNGDGTFQPAYTYYTGNPNVADNLISVGHLTGDGNLDLVLVNSSANTVSVMLGNGDGTFQPSVLYPATDAAGKGTDPVAMTLGDFTGDGRLGVVTANFGGDTVSVLLGNGDGTLQPTVTYPVQDLPRAVAVADVNHDGRLDIVAADEGNFNSGGTIAVLLGNGDGTFRPAVNNAVGLEPAGLVVGDFYGDGNPDVAVLDQSDSAIQVFAGRGDGSFASAPLRLVGNDPMSVAVGDFDRDGHPDVVTANTFADTVSVLLGNGDGTFRPAVSYPVGVLPWAVAVGDFNGDGNLDIVAANESSDNVSVLLGRGDGTFLPARTFSLGTVRGSSFPRAVAVGDLTGDGHTDIVTALSQASSATGDSEPGMVSVLLGRGDGTFQPAFTLAVGTDPNAVAIGDFNGRPGIVTANSQDNTVSVLQEVAGGPGLLFAPVATYPVGTDPVGVAVDDFNGHPAIVTANAGSRDPSTGNFAPGTVSVLLGDGSGIFSPAVTYPVGADPVGVVTGEFDGRLGIVTANRQDDTLTLLPGNGDGTFGAGLTLALAGDATRKGQVRAVAAGDCNGDGLTDLVATDGGSNTLLTLLGEGQGRFQPATPANGIAGRDVPQFADLNGDGTPDALTLDRSGELLYRQGLAAAPGQFAPPVVINPSHPARDATVLRTGPAAWAVAAVDTSGDTVSLYAWPAGGGLPQRSLAFATGHLPVRIAAADLTGDGRDDLVVANAFDSTVTVALRQSDGSFVTLTRPVGVGPSDIAFLDVPGQNGPDVVVSDQVSGDFTVLVNDSTPSSPPTFNQEYRYQAGTGPFDISTDPGTGAQSVLSQLQTVGLAAGDFTGSGGDLVVLDRGAQGLVLFPGAGQGRFAAPSPGNTYFPTGEQPSLIVPITLPGDALPGVAVLMEDLGQIWVYRNNGDGTFAAPLKIDAGNDPTGFAVAQVNGRLALRVGNAFGDILTLLYDGHGGFAPDLADLRAVALAVGTVPGTGQQFAVVADQQQNQVAVYFREPGTDRFASPIPIATQAQPLLAPGAVQMFFVPGDASPYLAVAGSLSNNVLVYHGSGDGRFDLLATYPVGDDPVSLTVADVNGDGVRDLLVVNRGSNDVSVLVGGLDPHTGLWTATPFQRLNSGGSGPVSVAVRDPGGANGPDLLVTNGAGTVTLLPGIGSGGKGSGFFQDTNPQTFALGSPITQSLVTAGGQFFVVGADGSLEVLTASGFAPLPVKGVARLDAVGAFLVAGLDSGGVDLLSAGGTVLARAAGFSGEPDALQALQNGNALDVYALPAGSDVPEVVSLPIPVLVSAPVAQAVSLPGSDLVLVATLLSGGLVERLPGTGGNSLPAEGTFDLFLPPGPGAADAGPAAAPAGAAGEPDLGPGDALGPGAGDGEPPRAGTTTQMPSWGEYLLDVRGAVRQRLRHDQDADGRHQTQDFIRDLLRQLPGLFGSPSRRPAAPKGEPPTTRRDARAGAAGLGLLAAGVGSGCDGPADTSSAPPDTLPDDGTAAAVDLGLSATVCLFGSLLGAALPGRDARLGSGPGPRRRRVGDDRSAPC